MHHSEEDKIIKKKEPFVFLLYIEQERCASQNTPVYIKRSCCQKFYL